MTPPFKKWIKTVSRISGKIFGKWSPLSYTEFMYDCEDKIIELEFEIREVKDRMNVYLDILNNIDTSVSELFDREKENERFGISENVDYRECLSNLRSALREYKRIYRVNF